MGTIPGTVDIDLDVKDKFQVIGYGGDDDSTDSEPPGNSVLTPDSLLLVGR